MSRALPHALVYHAVFHMFPSASYLDVLNNIDTTIPSKSVIFVTRVPVAADARYELDVPASPDQGYVRLLGLSERPWATNSCSAALFLP
jgi:hypothetical protein